LAWLRLAFGSVAGEVPWLQLLALAEWLLLLLWLWLWLGLASAIVYGRAALAKLLGFSCSLWLSGFG
jgi:hypothetical protein